MGRLRGQGHYYSPDFITNMATDITQAVIVRDDSSQVVEAEFENHYAGAYSTTKIADLALDFLDNRDQLKPLARIYTRNCRNYELNMTTVRENKLHKTSEERVCRKTLKESDREEAACPSLLSHRDWSTSSSHGSYPGPVSPGILV